MLLIEDHDSREAVTTGEEVVVADVEVTINDITADHDDLLKRQRRKGVIKNVIMAQKGMKDRRGIEVADVAVEDAVVTAEDVEATGAGNVVNLAMITLLKTRSVIVVMIENQKENVIKTVIDKTEGQEDSVNVLDDHPLKVLEMKEMIDTVVMTGNVEMIEIGVMIDVMIVGMTVEEVILVEEVVVAVTAEMMIEMVAMIVIVVMIERGEMTVMTGVTTGVTTVEMERDAHNDQGDSDAPDETRGRAREKARERENLMESTMLVTKDKSRYQNSLTHTPMLSYYY